jgi:hypothetical protein
MVRIEIIEDGIWMSLHRYHWHKPSWRDRKKRRGKKLRRHSKARRIKT